MTTPPEIVAQVRGWVQKAEHDFLAAKNTLPLTQKGLADIVCYHSQQCVEKYIKALLIVQGVVFPKTHDLRILLELTQKHTQLSADIRQVLLLNRYVIESRYPGNWDEITEKEAAEALNITSHFREQARALLPQETIKESG